MPKSDEEEIDALTSVSSSSVRSAVGSSSPVPPPPTEERNNIQKSKRGRPPKKQQQPSPEAVTNKDSDIPSFHRAAQYGQVETLETMLRKTHHDLLDSSDPGTGNTALHTAAAWGQADAVRMLLRAGADAEAVNLTGQTAQQVARTSDISHLIGEYSQRKRTWRDHSIWKGEDNDLKYEQDFRDAQGNCWLHLAAMMDRPQLMRRQFEHIFEDRLEDKLEDRLVNSANALGNTPLHDAMRYGSLGALECLLIDLQADWRIKNARGERPLDIWTGPSMQRSLRRIARRAGLISALDGGGDEDDDEIEDEDDEEIQQNPQQQQQQVSSREERKLQQMLAILERQRGEEEQQQRQQEAKRRTAKRGTARTSKKEESTTSLSAITPSSWAVDKTTGRTILHRLASRGAGEDRIGPLLQQHPDLLNSRDHGGYSALHEAALKGHVGVVRLLLERSHSKLSNAQADNGDTPLHDAVENGHVDVVRVLLEEGQADASIANREGRRPVDVAWDSEIKEILQRRNVEKSPRMIEGWSEPLLLVNVAIESGVTRWSFLASQVDQLYAHLTTGRNSKSSFTDLHRSIAIRPVTSDERSVLLSSPLMDRVPILWESLKTNSHHPLLLDKDGVYRAFSADQLSFGQVSVIYMDLQRLLPPAVKSSVVVVPLKVKMKMQRKMSKDRLV